MSAESAPVTAPPPAVSEEPVVAEAATDVVAAIAVSEAVEVSPAVEAAAAVEEAAGQAGSLPYERQQAAERIRGSAVLPPAMRDCLARVVEASGQATGGRTHVPVDELVRAVEEAVPDFLKIDRGRATAPAHPAGDAFFLGDPSAPSDQQAEEIAKAQLARSGLLRGQRVRVAD